MSATAIPQELLGLSDEEVQSRLNELKAQLGALTTVGRERGIITTPTKSPGGTKGKVLSASRQLALARYRFEREQQAVAEAEQALQQARDAHTQGGGDAINEDELTEAGNVAVANWKAAQEKIREKTRQNAAAQRAAREAAKATEESTDQGPDTEESPRRRRSS